MNQTYSNNKLFEIAKENYMNLVRYCEELYQDGYWDNPDKVLKKSINQVLDLYVQSMLVQLALYTNRLNNLERSFIQTVCSENAIGIMQDKDFDEEVLSLAKSMYNAPPILLQLCSLKDFEKKTCISSLFFDCILNILLAMSYLDDVKDMNLNTFIHEYYKKISVFVDSKNMNQRIIDNNYISNKINHTRNNMYQDWSDNNLLENIETEIICNSKESWTEYFDNLLKNKKKIKINLPKIEELKREQIEIDEIDKKNKLDELLKELNSLIGLTQVKDEINSLINLIKVRKLRQEHQMPLMDMSYHMVFTGNPGTGKTTVARLVANIYKELGLLTKGNLIETDRSGLVAGFVGQTAIKVKEIVEKAIGGVLFIDEAYSLANGIGTNDFGAEAIDTLVKMMEDHRDNLVVIVAGYSEEMQTFLSSNSGLVSRFNKFIKFSDYSLDELIGILYHNLEMNNMIIDDLAIEKIKCELSKRSLDKIKTFGNARGIRNVFEKIIVNQANRIVGYDTLTKEQLQKVTAEDVEGVI